MKSFKRLSKEEYENLKFALSKFSAKATDLDLDYFDEFYSKYKQLADMTLECKILSVSLTLSKVLMALNDLYYYLEIERED